MSALLPGAADRADDPRRRRPAPGASVARTRPPPAGTALFREAAASRTARDRPRRPRGGTGGGNVTAGPGAPGGRAGAIGGLLDAGRVSDALAAALAEDAASYTWVAATVGANSAAGYQLATGSPVMAVGGFNGTDPSPTLEQFQRYVSEGRIHWFIGSGTDLPDNGGSDAASRIAAWVQEHFEARTVDGVEMYDLTRPAG